MVAMHVAFYANMFAISTGWTGVRTFQSDVDECTFLVQITVGLAAEASYPFTSGKKGNTGKCSRKQSKYVYNTHTGSAACIARRCTTLDEGGTDGSLVCSPPSILR